VNKAGANALVFQLAHEVFKVPGDAGFALGGLLTPPMDKQEEGTDELLTVLVKCPLAILFLMPTESHLALHLQGHSGCMYGSAGNRLVNGS